jgi:hypothetical protein
LKLARRAGSSEKVHLNTVLQIMKRYLLPLAACTSLACGAESKPAVAPKAGASVRWVGRVDLTQGEAPKFAWSGSGLVAKVSGATLSVKLSTQGTSDDVYFQPVVDGAPAARVKVPPGEHTLVLASGLAPGPHTLELYRETEGNHGVSVFGGFVEGTLEPAPAATDRLLEIIGDSISAGYGNLGSEQHPNFGPDPSGGCHFTTETESAYLSYGAVAARTLGAEASILALSGWGAYRAYDSGTTNVMASVYANTLGTVTTPAWGFERKPQVVVINLGTNDFAKGNPGQSEFTGAYSALLGSVRGKYPEAWIFCMIGPMLYGEGLSAATTYITSIVAGAKANGDSKVRLLDVGQQDALRGTGCDWHPNAATHATLGARLASEIRSTVGW